MPDDTSMTPAAPSAKIIIVDDEIAQMKALCHTLSDEGYQTTGFASANAALEALRKQEFDLLLSDLMMPEMDGITLLRAALQARPDLVGIIMTGEGTIATAVEAMKTGALDYILKPFKLSVILPVIERALVVRRLRLKNAELERRIRERTSELEIANKDLEAFCHSVSHDLGAPLRHIEGFSELLLTNYASQMPPEAQRLLGFVTSSTTRMGQLIHDLLAFSRLGRQEVAKRPVRITDIVREVLADITHAHPNRSVEVKLGDLPDCMGDYSLLKQVYANLLSNAFKFSRNREKAVIEIGSQWQGDETVYFVRDNGAGFDMKYAKKLFNVFERLHSPEEFEGTGVGLSIVQRIIQRHGGRIWAESEEDKGATFYFTIPAAPAAPF